MLKSAIAFAALAAASSVVASVCVDEERGCYYPGQDCREPDAYTGDVSVTRDGDACVEWASLGSATVHGFKGLEGGKHSKCRNPDNSKAPWCYVKKPNKLFDFCFHECEGPAPTQATAPEKTPEVPEQEADPLPSPTPPKKSPSLSPFEEASEEEEDDDEEVEPRSGSEEEPEEPFEVTTAECPGDDVLAAALSGLLARYGRQPSRASAALNYYTRNIKGIRKAAVPATAIADEARRRKRLGVARLESWELLSLPSKENKRPNYRTQILALDAAQVAARNRDYVGPSNTLCTLGNAKLTAIVRIAAP